MWKVDNRGRFSTICTYRRAATGGLTHAIFRTEGVVKKARLPTLPITLALALTLTPKQP